MSTIASIDPATGHSVGEVVTTPVGEIPGIIARSRAAQERWADLSIDERVRVLAGVGPRLLERADELGLLLSREMGKPVGDGVGEVKACSAGWDEECAEIAEAIAPEVREDEKTRSTMYRDPYGVSVAITPWNFPMLMAHWQILPSLIAGNSVVFKPSEETPLIAQAYADALQESLPEDVLIVVHGDGEQGRALVAADGVDLITFTGSRAAGQHILAEASKQLKRVILELGGKDPLLVLTGADIDKAAAFAARNSFRNAGQVCVSTERIYVTEDVAPAFMDAFVAETAELTLGPGTHPDTVIGPMVNRRQRDKVAEQIEGAVAQGAQVAAGGLDAAIPGDNFIAPTILTGVTHEMDVAMEETFGPVAAVVTVADAEEALRLANDTPYGLGGVVFGEQELASRIGRRLCSGMVGINQGIYGASTDGGTPWIGARQSGYGFHHGREGHRQFCQARVVSTPKDA